MGTYEELWDSEMCQVCTNRNDELITADGARNDNLRLMSSSDWAALLLASIIITCGIYAELRDQMLCEFMLAAALQRSTGKGTIPRLLVSILGILRLFAFLPSMLTVVVALVFLHGGTALQICLNSVAVVFLVELDNMAFTYMLNEDLRKEAEEFAHTPVTASDRKVIDAIKWYYCSTIPFFIVGGVSLRGKKMFFKLSNSRLFNRSRFSSPSNPFIVILSIVLNLISEKNLLLRVLKKRTKKT